MIDPHDRHWYRDAVIYELHVKAFYDSNNDGIGDFEGLIQRLDYIADLGVTAIWLLPFYPSPLRDDGYDISDYKAIHPSYGDMRDFRRFIAAAHAKGIRVITELVINHTSDQHRWFQRARTSKPGSKFRDYYVWSDSDKKYPETRIIFIDSEKSNWTWDPEAQAYFWHRFYAHQPDLNFDNPAVFDSIMRVMRFWLDMGVDGLRLDAVPYLIEREGTNNENLSETHDILKRIRAEVDQSYPDRMLLAEANQWPEDTRPYFGEGDECHMAFHFPLMPRIYMAVAREDRYPITDILAQTPDIPQGCQWAIFLRNHDELTLEMVTEEERDYLWRTYADDTRARLNLGIRRRLAPLLDGDRRKIELLNGLLLSMPGTPVLYYGDEIGMGDNFFLGDRDGVRTPMQWSADRNGGFSRTDPQRLFLPPIMDPSYGYEAVNVEAQQKSVNSLLNWTKRMIAVRKTRHAFGKGSFRFLYPRNRKVLAYIREYEDELILCVFNLSRSAQAVELDLSAFRGRVPVELTGRSAFPPVSGGFYVITMPAYGFYWFNLAEEAALPKWHEPTPEPLPELATMVVTRGWDSMSEKHNTQQLERGVLPAYLHNQRWFGAKDATVKSVAMRPLGELQSDGGLGFLLLSADVELGTGEKQEYFLPLSFEWGDEALRPDNANFAYALAKIRRGAKSGALQEASVNLDFARSLLWAMRDKREIKSNGSTVRFESGGSLSTLELLPDAPDRGVSTEQSNTSIILADTVSLKIYRRLRKGVPPEIEMGRFLTEARFANTPAFLGAAEHHDQDGQQTALAVAFCYIHNQGDAWTVIVNNLERELENTLLTQLEAGEQPTEPGASLALIETLGKRTAEMHLALRPDQAVEDFAPARIGREDIARWRDDARERTEHAFDILQRVDNTLDDRARGLAEVFSRQRESVLSRISELGPTTDDGLKIRVHGDYHLGQVLVAENDVFIVDFEGEPAKSLEERRSKTTPAKDVAGMLRSFDYAARRALSRQAELGTPVERIEPLANAWRAKAAETFRRGYDSAMAASDIWPADRAEADRLLDLFLAEKVMSEIAYEAANRPAWVSLPLAGALALLGEGEQQTQ